jgi:hypothetical protein
MKILNFIFACVFLSSSLCSHAKNESAAIFVSGKHLYTVVSIASNDILINKDKWDENNVSEIKYYVKFSNSIYDDKYGFFLVDNRLVKLMDEFDENKHKENKNMLVNYLAKQSWGKNYVDSCQLKDMVIHVVSDINKNGLSEYWITYKTMYGQLGGLILETDRESDFIVISSDCPNCGD